MRSIKRLVIHCSGGRNTAKPHDLLQWQMTPKVNAQTGASSPYIPHVQGGRGWKRGGYHRMIDVSGHTHIMYPFDKITNGVKGYNADSIHLCVVGSEPEHPFTEAQWCELENQVKLILDEFPGIEVVGHRDLSPDKNGDGEITADEWIKTCPTFDVKEWMERSGMNAYRKQFGV